MIVSLCSDKGSPGVTTLALLLGLLWPGQAAVLEGDPSGGDLMMRLRPVRPSGAEFLAPEPSVFSLAADIRGGLATGPLTRYAQSASLGVRVIPGPPQAQNSPQLRSLWPAVAAHLAQAPELVFADLGRLQPGHAAWPLAVASGAVLVLARPSAEGLYHLRERVAHLASELGGQNADRNPVAAVMLASPREHHKVVDDAQAMLQASGSPIPVAGWMADDPGAVAAVRAGKITKRIRRGALFASVTELGTTLQNLWPQLVPLPDWGVEPPPAGLPAHRGLAEPRRAGPEPAVAGAETRIGPEAARLPRSRRAAREEPPR